MIEIILHSYYSTKSEVGEAYAWEKEVPKILVGNLYERCVLNHSKNGRIILRCILGKFICEVDVEMDLDRV
jgi:hypothetical protein